MKIYQSACFAIVDHLSRNPGWHAATVDATTNTRSRRLSAKDLFTEAERLLSRTSGGLSLLERLIRDPELREDMANLLKQIETDSKTSTAPR